MQRRKARSHKGWFTVPFLGMGEGDKGKFIQLTINHAPALQQTPKRLLLIVNCEFFVNLPEVVFPSTGMTTDAIYQLYGTL